VVDRTCERCGRPHGRPSVVGPNLDVSVSHSGDLALVAVADGVRVGVDIELIRPFEFVSLMDHVCDPSERAGVTDGAAFLRQWTRKEAVVKATGDGMRVPLREVVLAPPDASPRLLRYPGRPGLRATVRDLAITDGYAAAVAVLSEAPVRVELRDAFDRLAEAGLVR
jgi:4'-phosphopantetheinyl transferase